jgi:GNAT superfamily N-acetyltransferase
MERATHGIERCFGGDSLVIARAAPNDAKLVAEIFAEGYMSYEHPQGERGADRENLVRFVETSLRRRKGPDFWEEYIGTPGQEMYIGSINDEVVGYAAGRQVEAREPGAIPAVAELDIMAVASRLRRRCIGTELLRTVVERNSELGALATFACCVDWAPCRPFYEASGAVMLGLVETAKTGPATEFGIDLDMAGLALFANDAPRDQQGRADLLVQVRRHLY